MTDLRALLTAGSGYHEFPKLPEPWLNARCTFCRRGSYHGIKGLWGLVGTLFVCTDCARDIVNGEKPMSWITPRYGHVPMPLPPAHEPEVANVLNRYTRRAPAKKKPKKSARVSASIARYRQRQNLAKARAAKKRKRDKGAGVNGHTT